MSTTITYKDIKRFWRDIQRQVINESLYREMFSRGKLRVGIVASPDKSIGIVVRSPTCLTKHLGYNNIQISQRKVAEQWDIILKLLNSELDLPFAVLCSQIINGLKDSTQENAGQYLTQHLMRWNNLLSKKHELSDEKERGLWCELHILELAVKRYGIENALQAWVGPSGAPQDFCFENVFVEVKALLEKAGEVKISSLNQLDAVGLLLLALVGIEQSSVGLSLRDKVNKLKKIFSDPYAEALFTEALLLNGYSEDLDQVGSDKRYCPSFVSWYNASVEKFPSLKRSSISSAVLSAKYSLAVSSIEQFKTEGLF